jgi:WD40 repeat protein
MLFSGSLTGEICCSDLVAQEQCKIRDHIGKINCLAGDSKYLVSGGGDTATSIFWSTKPFDRVFTVPSYTGEVISCAVNSEFAAVASGTRDGSVLIFSTTSRTVVHVLRLDNRCPERILITKKWGFVVVYEREAKGGDVSRWIEVFTIDGLFVRKEKCPCDVPVWSTFSNAKGFDYIAMTDQKGAVYVFEAFYLKIGQPLCRCGEKLVGLSYAEDSRVLCAVGATGTGFFIPLCLNK